jgi:electron-transferring-flavoprotein dehydrogenase
VIRVYGAVSLQLWELMMSVDDPRLQPREQMHYDVVIVGAGPAGLATAIRLKQRDPNVSVVVLEKGAEVGAHILSGAVIDPIGLDELLPQWRKDLDCPLKTKVTKDRFYALGPAGAIPLPHFLLPKLMRNDGSFIGSLGELTRYLAQHAESLGVEIYAGFAAAELTYGEQGQVIGVATGDMGIDKEEHATASFTRGMELHGRYVILAEGARGSLSKQVIAKFKLDKDADYPKFGIGFKELWRVPQHKHQKGLIQHSFGWPLDNATGGGSFLYHYGEDLVSVGFVVHLNYSNPTLSPFDEFQRFKTHPLIREVLEGGTRLSYGARAITEGGYQSVPRLCFAGGALVGCAAGFVNVPRIKGSHNAMLSGILCADHLIDALHAGRSGDELAAYEDSWRTSAIGRDLYPVRNAKPLWSRFGTMLGIVLGGVDMWLQEKLKLSLFGTIKHGKADHETLKPLGSVSEIIYPKPDGVVSFDKLSSVFVSATNHAENQPCHLKLADPTIPIQQNLPLYGEPARLYCPAGVYEVVYAQESTKSDPHFVINAQNCVHCKTCDIKDPAQNITWIPPEGGGGPLYPSM